MQYLPQFFPSKLHPSFWLAFTWYDWESLRNGAQYSEVEVTSVEQSGAPATLSLQIRAIWETRCSDGSSSFPKCSAHSSPGRAIRICLAQITACSLKNVLCFQAIKLNVAPISLGCSFSVTFSNCSSSPSVLTLRAKPSFQMSAVLILLPHLVSLF